MAAAAAALLPLQFLLLSLLLLPSSSPSPDTPSLLLLLQSSPLDPRGVLHLPASLPPCRWLGVQCSSSSRVTRLVLESLDLRGSLPSPLPRLDELRLLSLKNNSLSGALPDLSPFPNLKSLFLSHNSLSGSLPSSLTLLPRLRSLDLSHNNLSGPLQPSLALLQSLSVLRLDSNSLSGPVPPFNQSSLKCLNLSHNSLSGPVPVTPILLAFGVPALDANPALCGLILRRECRDRGEFFRNSSDRTPAATTESPITADGGNLEQIRLPPGVSGPSRWTRHRRVLTAGLTAIGVLLIALWGVGIAIRKHKRVMDPRKGTEAAAAAADALERGGDGACDAIGGNAGSCELATAASLSEERVRKLGKSGCLVFCAGEAAVYSLEQLMRASAELLGRGTVGTTYKAVLDNRLIVSVKRVDAGRMGTAGKEEFERHMEMVGRLRHPNLVALRAYFQAKEERLLVYDYQPNGSLFSLIHGSRSTRAKPLHWTSCLKIAEDVAQGLAYIHQASRLVHGNIKSSNILLGSDFEACLTDSSLASLVEPPNGEVEAGYRAPETQNSNRNLTPKSDIYAFGILLLELLTGKPPLPQSFLVATDLPVWVRSVREDDGCEDERLMMLLDIVRECIRSTPESRPSTWQVLKMIQEVKESDAGDDVNPTDSDIP